MDENLKVLADELDLLRRQFIDKEENLLKDLDLEVRQKLGRPVKGITSVESFMANGRRYFIRTSLTVTRFEKFEQIQIRVGYGVDFRQLFNNLMKIYDDLNNMKPADAAITVHGMMHGIKDKIEERENEVLLLCSLFVCREGEDLTTYDDQLTRDKIEDWKKEGIAMESFFTLAFNLVNGFTPIYKQVSASISQEMTQVKEEIQKRSK